MSVAGDLLLLGYTLSAVLAFVGLAVIVVTFVARVGLYTRLGSATAARFEALTARLGIERTAPPNVQRLAWAYAAVLAPLLALRLGHSFAENGSVVVPMFLVAAVVVLQVLALRQATHVVENLPSV